MLCLYICVNYLFHGTFQIFISRTDINFQVLEPNIATDLYRHNQAKINLFELNLNA